MASVIYRCPTKAVKVQVWFDEPTNDRETYISIRCPACARVHLVNPVTGKTPANGTLSLSGRPPVTNVPRGKYLGKRVGDPPKDEAEHFIRCPACGGWVDCRDLGQVFEHEGPLPHPSQDQPQ
jgi:DNA-directed RNA polymerase subunit RPC12/RpoP